ncbi:hypothetical protein [Methanosphaerula palustris]|uniref:Uncharacterized protein n=1 Tax=Methanosphaerula palustris (strain ATCC BAA-1556 / DSM 19958 / E1-9c) TaxID=521011 RepID=B8GIS4_METPE|nr:hypothetical protein [Methanosphaerula palustris]ACL16887.1 hypothetical protein Mpal_1574 [Methanosphaerula palustris E1-9c]
MKWFTDLLQVVYQTGLFHPLVFLQAMYHYHALFRSLAFLQAVYHYHAMFHSPVFLQAVYHYHAMFHSPAFPQVVYQTVLFRSWPGQRFRTAVNLSEQRCFDLHSTLMTTNCYSLAGYILQSTFL